MKLPLWINSCHVEERSVRLAYKTKMVTDCQKTLGIWHNQPVTRGSISPTGKVQGLRWYRDWRRVTRGLCWAGWRYKPRRRRWWGWLLGPGENPATPDPQQYIIKQDYKHWTKSSFAAVWWFVILKLGQHILFKTKREEQFGYIKMIILWYK